MAECGNGSMRSAHVDLPPCLPAGCRDRGIRVGRPIFEDTRRSLRGPWVEALGGGEGGEADTTLVHWPVVLLYPETGQVSHGAPRPPQQSHARQTLLPLPLPQSDYIEDVSEVTTLAEILELVLPDDGVRARTFAPSHEAPPHMQCRSHPRPSDSCSPRHRGTRTATTARPCATCCTAQR